MSLLARGYVAGVLVYLFAPVAVTVLFSFADSPRLSLPVTGLTMRWYRQVFAEPLFLDALENSLLLAAMTSAIAGVLGASFSFGLLRLRRRSRQALLTAGLLPAAIPALVLGVALALFFRELGWASGMRNAAIGQIAAALPYVILTMYARLESFDFTVLEAARDLGATPWRAFRDITLPLIRPSLLGAVLLTMAMSLDEFVITWFNVGTQQTLPVLIWGLMRRGIDPSINALATLILFSLAMLVALARFFRRHSL